MSFIVKGLKGAGQRGTGSMSIYMCSNSKGARAGCCLVGCFCGDGVVLGARGAVVLAYSFSMKVLY